MKKNLLSVLILALLAVNIVLTTIMMISITNTNAATAKLVDSVLAVMNIELYSPGGTSAADVALEDSETFDFEGSMTIPLKASDGDDKQHYILFDLSLFINTKHEDYKTYGGEKMKEYESRIKAEVNDLVSSYTLEECENGGFETNVRPELLRKIQQLFQSDFIYKIGVNEIKFG